MGGTRAQKESWFVKLNELLETYVSSHFNQTEQGRSGHDEWESSAQ